MNLFKTCYIDFHEMQLFLDEFFEVVCLEVVEDENNSYGWTHFFGGGGVGIRASVSMERRRRAVKKTQTKWC